MRWMAVLGLPAGLGCVHGAMEWVHMPVFKAGKFPHPVLIFTPVLNLETLWFSFLEYAWSSLILACSKH